jgi:hypothetical protein
MQRARESERLSNQLDLGALTQNADSDVPLKATPMRTATRIGL